MRAKTLIPILTIFFLVLFLGLFNLQILQSGKFKELSNKNCIRLLPQPGARGRILDRNNEIIIDNYLTYDCMVLPQEKNQLDKTLAAIAVVLEVDLRDLRSKFKSGYSAPFIPVTITKNINIKKAIALEEVKMDYPGIVIQPRPIRSYPYGNLACHLIGYLNEIDRWRLRKLADYGYNTKDIVGYTGLEERYDYYLRQEDGALSVEVDHRGSLVRVLGFKPPKGGKDIQLTLNLKIQKIIEECFAQKMGNVVIMDPYTGEIIALANSPGYNPELFIRSSSFEISRLFNDPDSPLFNRTISGLYSPGSVFKLIVAVAALETNKINPGTTFFCSGSMHVGNRRFNCWDVHNKQNLLDAIAHSCDVFFYRTGLLLGAQAIHDYAVKFGFSKLTHVDLPYEAGGMVPDPLWKKLSRFQNWYDGDTANFSIGQGELLVTPLQIARMTAVFANQGFLVNPYIVKAIEGQDISTYQRRILRLGFKKKTLDYVRGGARLTVSDLKGTANILSSLEIAVAGKTGTTQVSRGQSHGWFSGFFPYQEPKFVICVFLEHGGSGHAACVLTKQIIEAMIKEGLI